jgi:hypothetical protein
VARQHGPQSFGQLEQVSDATVSHTPSPQAGQGLLQTAMLPGHNEVPDPPEHSPKVQLVVPPQYIKHGDPPEHVTSHPVTSSQLTLHRPPPEQSTLQLVSPLQST